MPRLESFTIKIKTGENGRGDSPKFAFNTIPCEFEDVTGSCEAGEVMEGFFAPRSFVHSFTLTGPDSGTWDIEEVEITFLIAGEFEPYTIKFGPAKLDGESDLNLWQERPAEVWDV